MTLRGLHASALRGGLAIWAEVGAALCYRSACNGVTAFMAWLSVPLVHAKMVLVASAFVYPIYASAVVENAIAQYLPHAVP